MLGLSEKTVRRRIKDGTLKAEQIQGKYGAEYRITGINYELSQDKDIGLDMDKSPGMDKGLDKDEVPDLGNGSGIDEGSGLDKNQGMDNGVDIEEDPEPDSIPGMVKSLDIAGNATLAKALDIIKALQEENAKLAGQVGFLQAKVLELDSKVRLLTEPKDRRPWWQWFLWWKAKPEA